MTQNVNKKQSVSVNFSFKRINESSCEICIWYIDFSIKANCNKIWPSLQIFEHKPWKFIFQKTNRETDYFMVSTYVSSEEVV